MRPALPHKMVVGLVAVLCACGAPIRPPLDVTVHARRDDTDTVPRTFAFAPSTDAAAAGAEASARARLIALGMTEAREWREADALVTMRGAVDARTIREVVSTPLWRTVPGQPIATMVQVGTDAQGRPIYAQQMVHSPPEQVYGGERVTCESVEYFEHTLSIELSEAGGRARVLWSANAAVLARDALLSKRARALGAAASARLGAESSDAVVVSVRADGRVVPRSARAGAADSATKTPEKGRAKLEPRTLGRC